MITATLDAAGEYTSPLKISRRQSVAVEVKESTADLVATVSLQWNLEDQPTQPNSADTGWTTVKTVDVGSVAQGFTFDGPPGWYRVGVESGNLTQGAAAVKIKAYDR